MNMYPDVSRVAGEVRKLRGGLSDLAQTVNKSLWRAGDEAEDVGGRAWSAARPYGDRALATVEENPIATASVIVGIAALAGLYILVRNVFLARAHAPRGRIRRKRQAAVAAAGPVPRTKRSPARPRRKTCT